MAIKIYCVLQARTARTLYAYSVPPLPNQALSIPATSIIATDESNIEGSAESIRVKMGSIIITHLLNVPINGADKCVITSTSQTAYLEQAMPVQMLDGLPIE